MRLVLASLLIAALASGSPVTAAPKAKAAEAPAPGQTQPSIKVGTKPVADQRPGLAVTPISGEGSKSSSQLTALLDEALLTQLRQSGRFSRIVGGSDLRAVIDLEAQRSMLG